MGGEAPKVLYNPQEARPRKGTFEVKVNGDVVLSLVGMPRPFKRLRELDFDEVAEEIKTKLKATA